MKKILIITLFSAMLIYAYSEGDLSGDKIKDMSDDIPVFEGKETTIYATDEKSQQIKKIDSEEIKKINPSDMSDLLKEAFNLDIINNGSYGNNSTVNIRGLSGSRILILIDGVPVNSIQSGSFDLSTISINDIEEIQLIKGGSDTKYNFSGAIGGIINIITKKRKKPGFSVYSSFSNLFYYPGLYYVYPGTDEKRFSKIYDFADTQNMKYGFNIGNKTAQWSISSEANRAFNHFLYNDADGFKRRRIDNEIWDISGRTNLSFNLPSYIKLSFAGNYFYANRRMPGPVTSDSVGTQVEHNAGASVFLDADYVGSERIDTEFTASYKFADMQWYDMAASSDHKINTVNIISRWNFLAAKFLAVNAGGDFEYGFIDSTDLGRISVFNGGGYITLDFTILKKAKIIPSVKLIYFKDYPVAVPKLGLVFYPGGSFVIKNNYYRTFRLPAVNDLYWPEDSFAEGNPGLKPEDGIGGDFILSYFREKMLSAETSIYVNYIKDAILWQPSSGRWRPLNVGKAFYFGFDCEVKSDFSRHVQLKGAYSFLLTYALSDDFTFESDKRMPYNPMHSFGFGVTFSWKNGTLNFTGNFKSERYMTTSNVTKLDPYFTLDINFNQTIKIVTLSVSVKNAFNYLYYLMDGYPMPGGSVTLGVGINYGKNFKQKNKK